MLECQQERNDQMWNEYHQGNEHGELYRQTSLLLQHCWKALPQQELQRRGGTYMGILQEISNSLV